jgi:4-carboxymuconolactone decarboxylase
MAGRIDIDLENLDAAQAQVRDAIVSGPRGLIQGPLKVWLVSSELAERAQSLGAFCRYGTSLPARLSELAILVTGAHWRAGFEWAVHAPIAVAAGLGLDATEALRRGVEPAFEAEDERAVYRFCHSLLSARQVPDEEFAAAVAVLGDKGVVELVGVLGYYGLISMTINVFKVPLPEGVSDPFVEGRA